MPQQFDRTYAMATLFLQRTWGVTTLLRLESSTRRYLALFVHVRTKLVNELITLSMHLKESAKKIPNFPNDELLPPSSFAFEQNPPAHQLSRRQAKKACKKSFPQENTEGVL